MISAPTDWCMIYACVSFCHSDQVVKRPRVTPPVPPAPSRLVQAGTQKAHGIRMKRDSTSPLKVDGSEADGVRTPVEFLECWVLVVVVSLRGLDVMGWHVDMSGFHGHGLYCNMLLSFFPTRFNVQNIKQSIVAIRRIRSYLALAVMSSVLFRLYIACKVDGSEADGVRTPVKFLECWVWLWWFHLAVLMLWADMLLIFFRADMSGIHGQRLWCNISTVLRSVFSTRFNFHNIKNQRKSHSWCHVFCHVVWIWTWVARDPVPIQVPSAAVLSAQASISGAPRRCCLTVV